MFKHILVPVDGSQHSGRAVAVAGDLAKRYGASVLLVHVLGESGSNRVPEELASYAKLEHVRISERDLIQSAGREILDVAKQQMLDLGVENCQTELRSGDAAGEIVAATRNSGVDLIVMGRRGLGDLKGLLLGSVSHKIAQAVDCCNLTVK